jgi:hypothetical protein
MVTKNHIRALIDKKIFDFVAVETHAIVQPFGVVIANATILNPQLPTKWSNQK